MLLVWLLATFASWANACLLQSSAAAANVPGHVERVGFALDADTAHAAAAGVGPTRELDPAQEACGKFCETERNIVAKAQPAKGEAGADAPVLPLATLGGWPAFTPERAGPRWRPPSLPPPPGPPVAIAFLRLTL